MTGHRYVPRPPLSRHVECFWAYDAYGAGHTRERVLPTASSDLIVMLGDDCAGPVVCGAHSEPFVIDTADRPTLLGVHFRPGGAVPFLKMPADELGNARVPLDALWGRMADELKERILEARTWAAPHVQTIGRLTERVGLSPRRFIQVFTKEVGLTPKVFCRVRRFQRVLTLIEREEAIDWAAVAVAGGYYDQAHFIHDFRAFSGINPTAYLRADVRERNHVPLED